MQEFLDFFFCFHHKLSLMTMKRRSGVVACSFLPVYKILLLKIDTFKLEIDTLQEAIELSTAEKGFNYCSAA